MSLSVKSFKYPVEKFFLLHDFGNGKKQIGVTMKISDKMPYFGNAGNTREQNTRSPFYQKVKATFVENPLVNFFNPPIMVWAKNVELIDANGTVQSEHYEGKDGAFDGAHRQDLIAEILREGALKGDRFVSFIFYTGFDPIVDKDMRVDIASSHNQNKVNKSHSIDDTRGLYDCIKDVFTPLGTQIEYRQNQFKRVEKQTLRVSILISYLACFMPDLFPSPDDRGYYAATNERQRIQIVRHSTEIRDFYIKNLSTFARHSALFPQILELVEMIRYESLSWFRKQGHELITETFVNAKNRPLYMAQENMITPVNRYPVCYKVPAEELALRVEKKNWLGLVEPLTLLLASSFRHLIVNGRWVADFDEIKAFVEDTVPEMLFDVRARRKEVLSINDYLRMETAPTPNGDKKFVKGPWDKFYEETKQKWKQRQTLHVARAGIPEEAHTSVPNVIVRRHSRMEEVSAGV